MRICFPKFDLNLNFHLIILFICRSAVNVAKRINSLMFGNYFPEAALLRLSEYLSPLERLKLQQCCKHFHTVYGKWLDITAVDIRVVEQNGMENISF